MSPRHRADDPPEDDDFVSMLVWMTFPVLMTLMFITVGFAWLFIL